jgi:hypothetical protein
VSGRREFHERNQARAEAQARDWLERRDELGGQWLSWVAGQLYQLEPAEYAAMVRRELQRLTEGG